MDRQEYARARCGGGEVLRAVDCAVILAARCKGPAQLDACEDALLAADAAHELDYAVHAAGHVDEVADIDILPVCHAVGRGRCAAGECAERGLARNGARGEGEVRGRFRWAQVWPQTARGRANGAPKA